MITIRKAVYDDLQEISRIDEEIFLDESHPQKIWSHFFFTGTILVAEERIMSDDNELIEVVIVGFTAYISMDQDSLFISPMCSEFMAINEIMELGHIASLGVLESHRCKGIGQTLITEVLSQFNKLPITLNVRVSNEKAINLYRKNEFHIYENKELNYYNNPSEDAYFMFRMF